MNFALIFEAIKWIGGVLGKALSFLFVYDYANKKTENKELKEDLKDAKKAQKLDNSAANLSDDELDKLL